MAYWIMLVVGAAAIAGGIGFAIGRGTAPGERALHESRRERDAARAEAEQVQVEVARHFEESARMFGRLADDYRTFFEHFAHTAQNLGMSESRARELLQRADPRLAEPGAAGAVGVEREAVTARRHLADAEAGGREADAVVPAATDDSPASTAEGKPAASEREPSDREDEQPPGRPG